MNIWTYRLFLLLFFNLCLDSSEKNLDSSQYNFHNPKHAKKKKKNGTEKKN